MKKCLDKLVEIDVRFYYRVDELLGGTDDVLVKVNEKEFERAINEAFYNLVEEIVCSQYDCGYMAESMTERLVDEGIIEIID